MRRTLAVAAMSVLCGCHPTINFDVSATTTTPTIPGSSINTGLMTLSFPPTTFDIAQQSGFQSAQAAKDRIQSAHATKLTLKVIQPPSGQDLSFLKSITIEIDAANLPPVRIASASASQFPAGATSADLILDDVELAPYLKAASFTLTTSGSGTAPQRDTKLQGDLTLNLEASVF